MQKCSVGVFVRVWFFTRRVHFMIDLKLVYNNHLFMPLRRVVCGRRERAERREFTCCSNGRFGRRRSGLLAIPKSGTFLQIRLGYCVSNVSVRLVLKGYWTVFNTGYQPVMSDDRMLCVWLYGEAARTMELLTEQEVVDGLLELLNYFLADRFNISRPVSILR